MPFALISVEDLENASLNIDAIAIQIPSSLLMYTLSSSSLYEPLYVADVKGCLSILHKFSRPLGKRGFARQNATLHVLVTYR